MLPPIQASTPSTTRSRWRTWLVGLAAPVLAVALIAACGSDGGSSESSNAGKTEQEGSTGSTDGKSSSTKVDTSTSELPNSSAEATVIKAPKQDGVQHLKFKYGPVKIEPGQNNITFSEGDVPKPEVDGYITAIYPDLVYTNGEVPRVDILHLHHGVWVNMAGGRDGQNRGAFGQELFFASGEEKTHSILPAGYGYEYKATDPWLINYMLHNLLSTPDEVYIVYDIDFIPKSSPAAKAIKPAKPVWMDVEKGSLYPVFDVIKGDGKDGVYTYPDDADDPYGDGAKKNEWVVPEDMTLLGTGGHLHPGGLHTDMYVTRDGEKKHLFESKAIYYEPAGAVSWDVSMTVTPSDWMVRVKKGDVLSISATYDTTRASWYESMGIMVTWVSAAPGVEGRDPFTVDVSKVQDYVTHGPLPENRNHGGEKTDEFVDATKLPDGQGTDKVTIADFTYGPGDIGGIYDNVPTVKAGQPLSFYNADENLTQSKVWHTVTSCKAPCDKATGIAYPLADSDIQFDSGELGTDGPPTAGTLEWTVPSNLPQGTYTYFCRIHPSMRGAFRVKG